MKKILLVCNSVFQIIVASHIAYSKYRGYAVSIILSDYLTERDKLANAFKKSGYFDKVYVISIRQYNRNEITYNLKEKILYLINSENELKRYVDIKDKYDVVLVSNINKYTNLLAKTLGNRWRKMEKSNIKVCLYEDGTVSYTKIYEKFLEKQKEIKKRLDKYYLYAPELCEWKNVNIEKIEKMNSSDGFFITMLNKLFEFEVEKEEIKEPIIFFEESYNLNESQVDDLDILEEICQYIPKERIAVKLHPRSEKDRFSPCGYRVLKQSRIPFELYAANYDLSDKVLITIASGSASNCEIVLGKSVNTISIYNCLRKYPDILQNGLKHVIKKIYANYSNMYMPNSLQAVVEKIQELS